ncbi:MAG: EamA family transporter [Pseudomonadota bacterium]
MGDDVMLVFSTLAALAASAGWAIGTVLAERPAQALGSFAFIRIQVTACSVILFTLCSVLSLWSTVSLADWPNYAVSTSTLLMGLLCFTSCLRMGGPRRSEIIFALRAPIVAVLAFAWLGEILSTVDIIGGALCLLGVMVAVLAKDRQGGKGSTHTNVNPLFIGIGLLGVTCQGLSYLAVKPALESGTSPFAVSAIHLIGAAMIVSVIAQWPSTAIMPQSALTPWLVFRTILPGVIGYVLASSALLYALATSNAGVAAVLGSLAPVLVIPIQAARDRRAPRRTAVLGALLAVVGAAIIVVY